MARLEKLHDDIHVLAIPHSMLGLQLGARMTVLRLPDRSLALFSPIRIDDALAAEIAALGDVAHVIAPNAFHHLFAGDAIRRYPKATLHAAKSLRRKRPDLRIDATFDDATKLGDGIEALEIRGSMMNETVLFHAPSSTLITVDLVENFVDPASDLFTRLYLKAAGLEGGVGWSLFLKPVYRDKREARRSLDRILDRPWNRAVIAHGRVIDTDARDSVRDALAWIR